MYGWEEEEDAYNEATLAIRLQRGKALTTRLRVQRV
jgi:hypothetical protein